MNQISVITPTRDRSEAFALCVHWMSRQTYEGPVRWIIVDDGDIPVDRKLWDNWPKPGWEIFYKRRPPSTDRNTLPYNMRAALKLVAGDKILIAEDDEYYSPRFIEEMSKGLDSFDIFGEGPAVYYNVVDRTWRQPKDAQHASLCRTGFRASQLPRMQESVDRAALCGDPWIDLRFWGLREIETPENIRKMIAPGLLLSIGIKGLPGRAGLGTQHKPGIFPCLDHDMAELRRLIGEDAKAYARFFQGERKPDSVIV